MAGETLNVRLEFTEAVPTGGTAFTVYYLKAENAAHSQVRYALQAPLPASGAGDTPKMFTLDLGQIREEITIQGVVDSTGSVSGEMFTTASPTAFGYGGTGIPSKVDLVKVGRNWWGYGAGSTAIPSLYLGTTESYRVHVKSCDFRWEGSLEDRWQFTITCLVASDTEVNWL